MNRLPNSARKIICDEIPQASGLSGAAQDWSSLMDTGASSERRFNRRLYLGASLLFLGLVFWTFARTFYLKHFFVSPSLSTLLYVHGTVMTGWVVLLVAQSGLVAVRRVQWHRQLGIFGSVWAGLVVLLGSLTTLHAAAREVRNNTAFASDQIVITSLDMLQMAFFAAFVTVAIWHRRRLDYHKRLMLLTIACMLPDALARLPISFMTHASEIDLNLRIMGGLDLFIVICLGVDTVRHHRLHPAFAWGGLLFVAAFHMALYVTRTPTWLGFGRWIFS